MASAPEQVPEQQLRQVATVATAAGVALRLFSRWSRHREAADGVRHW